MHPSSPLQMGDGGFFVFEKKSLLQSFSLLYISVKNGVAISLWLCPLKAIFKIEFQGVGNYFSSEGIESPNGVQRIGYGTAISSRRIDKVCPEGASSFIVKLIEVCGNC